MYTNKIKVYTKHCYSHLVVHAFIVAIVWINVMFFLDSFQFQSVCKLYFHRKNQVIAVTA